MKRFSVVLTFLAVSSITTGFAQGTLPIGVITSLTGRYAEFGKQHQAGFAVALAEINAAGGVNGQQVELVLRDDTSDVNAALSAAESLTRDVPLVLGAYSSSITNPLAQFFTRQGFPFLVFTSSEDAITNPGSEWTFRLNQPASAYATVLFDIFDQLNSAQNAGLKTIALIHGNGSFESSVADAVVRLSQERGYNLTEQESYDRGVTDFRPILNRFATNAPDVVFMVSYAEDSVGLLRQASEVGLNPKLFAGGAAGFALPNFIEGAGAAANYVVTATTWTKDAAYPGAQDLYTRLKKQLGGTEPSYHAAQAYAGLITAADALGRAADTSPEAVREALKATNLTETAYGPIKFENYGGFQNQNPLSMLAQQVQNGAFVTVFPKDAAQAELIFPTPAWNAR